VISNERITYMTNNNKNELSRFINGYSCEGNNKRFMKEKEHKR